MFLNFTEGTGILEIGSVNAKDVDSGDNGRISYSILQPVKGYYIEASSGAIFVNYSALSNSEKDIQLAIVATDHGKPNKTSMASLRISSGASSEIKPFIGQDTYRYVYSNYFLLFYIIASHLTQLPPDVKWVHTE